MGLMSHQVSNYFQHDTVPQRIGTGHPSVVPYQSFPASDGIMFIAAANQNLWERLARTLGLEALIAEERFKDNPTRVAHREDLVPLLTEVLLTRTTAEWMGLLRAAGVPCAPVNNLRQVMEDGQVEAIGALAELEDPTVGKLRCANLPFFLDGQKGRVTQRAPRLGEHTRTVLSGLGYGEDKIENLLQRGAIQDE
jgi:crotonobetainyl-CoA:carnitine CoA-transferase CaiB-like acyl-CoA transferase